MEIYLFCGQLDGGCAVHLGDLAEYMAHFADRAAAIGIIGENGADFSGSAICLGDFDGVHRGHMALFELAEKYPRRGALIFDRSSKGGAVLTTLSEKLEIIGGLGLDYALIMPFSEEFAASTPEQFVKFLASIGIAAAVAGYDYRFGRGAAGDAGLLKELAEGYGFCAEIAGEVTDGGEPVKSTKIRALVKNGELRAAARLLGRSYSVSSEVEKGLQNGRRLGFPTANLIIHPEKLLPPDGVYFGRVCGRKAVINIGNNPTFSATERTLEAHVPGFSGDMYGARVKAELIEKIRPDFKFNSRQELIEQIAADIRKIERME